MPLLISAANRARYSLAKNFSLIAAGRLENPRLGTVAIKCDQTLATGLDTRLDELFQRMLKSSRFFADGIISEESIESVDLTASSRWILDSVDGTDNLANNRLPQAVSLGYWENNRPIFGFLVYPDRRGFRVLSGLPGDGIFLNGRRIIPAMPVKPMGGLDFHRLSKHPPDTAFIKLLNEYRCEIRVPGSNACGLAEVALGSLNFFLTITPKIWDVGAVVPILLAANRFMNYKKFDLKEIAENDFNLGFFLAAVNRRIFNQVNRFIKP